VTFHAALSAIRTQDYELQLSRSSSAPSRSRQFAGNRRTRRIANSDSKIRHAPFPFESGLPAACSRTLHCTPSVALKINGADSTAVCLSDWDTEGPQDRRSRRLRDIPLCASGKHTSTRCPRMRMRATCTLSYEDRQSQGVAWGFDGGHAIDEPDCIATIEPATPQDDRESPMVSTCESAQSIAVRLNSLAYSVAPPGPIRDSAEYPSRAHQRLPANLRVHGRRMHCSDDEPEFDRDLLPFALNNSTPPI
jgi:hypothetical protein